MRVLLSTHCLHNNDAEASFKLGKTYGFDGIELFIRKPVTSIEIQYLKSLEEEYGLKILNVHMPSWWRFVDEFYKRPEKIGYRHIEESCNITTALNAQTLTIHPFPSRLFKTKTKKIFSSILKSMKKYNVNISIENLGIQKRFGVPYEPYCISSYNDLFAFCNENDLGITLDISHAASKKNDPSKYFLSSKGRINSIHISNFKNGFCHQPLMSGMLNIDQFCNTLISNSYQGTLNLEVDPMTLQGLSKNIEYLLSCLGRKGKAQKVQSILETF